MGRDFCLQQDISGWQTFSAFIVMADLQANPVTMRGRKIIHIHLRISEISCVDQTKAIS